MPSLVNLLLRAVDGIFVVDSRQRIVFWDPSCAQLLGISSENAIGGVCSEVLRGKSASGLPFCRGGCCVARLTMGEAAPNSFPLWVCGATGQDMRLLVSIMLVPSARKDCWLCVHLLRRGDGVDAMQVLHHGTTREGYRGRADNARASPMPLSAREQEVLRLLAEGLSVPCISRLLYITPTTVRNHLQRIQTKLGVHSQVETVAYAYRHSLV